MTVPLPSNRRGPSEPSRSPSPAPQRPVASPPLPVKPAKVKMGATYNAAHFVLGQIGQVPSGYNNCFIYLFIVRMATDSSASTSTVIAMAHTEQMTEAQVSEKVQAVQSEIEVRLRDRRKTARFDASKPIDTLNMECFQQDVEWFGVVMADKYGFQRVLTADVLVNIPPTATRAQ